MLIIRTKQMEAFKPSLRQRFEHDLTELVAANYPALLRQDGGRGQIGALVRLGMQQAAAGQYRSKRQVSLMVSLMLMLGVDFARDPQLPWVAAYLDPQAIADPTMRLDALMAAALDYLGATAGEDGEHLVGALERLRYFKLASVPGRTGEGWISDICRILLKLYPEKFSHQGEPAMRKLVWLGTRRARQHVLAAPGDMFVVIVLMFLFGSGFDSDPLYAWAQAGLEQRGNESTRAARLYMQALSQLEQSLGEPL